MTKKMKIDPSSLTYVDMVRLIEEHGSERAAARAIGLAKSTFRDRLHALKAEIFRAAKLAKPIDLPTKGKVTRWIFSSAQDETEVFGPWLDNLEAYADYLNATLHISGHSYNKSLYEEHSKHNGWYDDRVQPYLTQERLNVGKNLVFCGEMNTLPTAVRPLSGFERYTGDKWGIFPHPKYQLLSLPTQKHQPAKVIMTTGTVTKPNYVQKKAGLKAEYDHIYGAVLVELDRDGRMYIRHLHASSKDGSFHDLDVFVKNGKLKFNQPVMSINWPDIHAEKMDYKAANVCWGQWGNTTDTPVVEALQPQYQFFHDAADFMGRNHHNINDPHFLFEMYVNGMESVERNMMITAEFLKLTERDFSQSVIVESNHDHHFSVWLKNGDYRKDPVNAEFFLKSQARVYQAIRERDEDFSIFQHTLSEMVPSLEKYIWLGEDDSFKLCDDGDGGIEYGMHGHLGANGSRGTPMQFTKFGPRIWIGHGHAAMAFDGMMRTGVFALDMKYNRGPSSWNQVFGVTHVTGKRQLVWINDDQYRSIN